MRKTIRQALCYAALKTVTEVMERLSELESKEELQ